MKTEALFTWGVMLYLTNIKVSEMSSNILPLIYCYNCFKTNLIYAPKMLFFSSLPASINNVSVVQVCFK